MFFTALKLIKAFKLQAFTGEYLETDSEYGTRAVGELRLATNYTEKPKNGYIQFFLENNNVLTVVNGSYIRDEPNKNNENQMFYFVDNIDGSQYSTIVQVQGTDKRCLTLRNKTIILLTCTNENNQKFVKIQDNGTHVSSNETNKDNNDKEINNNTNKETNKKDEVANKESIEPQQEDLENIIEVKPKDSMKIGKKEIQIYVEDKIDAAKEDEEKNKPRSDFPNNAHEDECDKISEEIKKAEKALAKPNPPTQTTKRVTRTVTRTTRTKKTTKETNKA